MILQDKFTTNRTYQLLVYLVKAAELVIFVGEWALQHNRPLLPFSRAKSHEKCFLKAPLES